MTFTLHAACGRLDAEPVALPPDCRHSQTDANGLCLRCGRFVGHPVGTCPRCGETDHLTNAPPQDVEFTAALCHDCRDLTVRELLLASFQRLMGQIEAAEEA